MTNKSTIFYFIKAILLLAISLSNTHAQNNTRYCINGELVGKYNIDRSIARLGLVIPILQKQDNLLYIPAFIMVDSNNAIEFNVGLGFRKIFKNKLIHGLYAFYDRRKSNSNNTFQQLTIGYELFTTNYELRANVYLPKKQEISFHHISQKYISINYNGSATQYNFRTVRSFNKESANPGLDVELATSIFKTAFIYFSYYKFYSSTNPIDGTRIRGNATINGWSTIESEICYDKVRKITVYLGLSLNYPKRKIRNSLRKSMTSIPVRDIDIVIDKTKVYTNHETSKEYDGYVPLIYGKMDHLETKLADYNHTFYSTLLLPTDQEISDLICLDGDTFVQLGSLQGQYLSVDSNVERDFSNISLINTGKCFKKHSPIYKAAESGYWTDIAYKNKIP